MAVDLSAMSRPTLVEVWAPGCVECRAMKPDIEATAGEFAATVDFVAVDGAQEWQWAREAKVMATPTIIGVTDGAEVFRVVGRRNRTELQALFAAIDTGAVAAPASREDRILRVGGGVLLAAVGLAMGPAWPLVIGGVGITGWGLASGRWSGRG